MLRLVLSKNAFPPLFLFNIVIDLVKWKPTNMPSGISWKTFTRLEDLFFVDDMWSYKKNLTWVKN